MFPPHLLGMRLTDFKLQYNRQISQVEPIKGHFMFFLPLPIECLHSVYFCANWQAKHVETNKLFCISVYYFLYIFSDICDNDFDFLVAKSVNHRQNHTIPLPSKLFRVVISCLSHFCYHQ